MTTQDILNRIADISCSVYDGASAEDMKEALDALWNDINNSKNE